MSCGLTSGRTEPCRDNQGGIRFVYLFPYVDYLFNQIVGTKGVELTSFPTTTIYKYEIEEGNFSETITNNEDGISYSQNLSFNLFKQDLLTTRELNILTNIDFRYIVEYNNGDLKIGGLFNGANVNNLTIVSGGNKSSLNGYNISFESNEEYKSAFISDLASVGFIVEQYLLLEDLTNILLENSELLALE